LIFLRGEDNGSQDMSGELQFEDLYGIFEQKLMVFGGLEIWYVLSLNKIINKKNENF